MSKHCLIFFLDGVGLGVADPEINPFVTADMPNLTQLFGEGWYLATTEGRASARASLMPTDANLGLEGRPQSATGQATILSGRNIPAEVGEHYGPKPNDAVREAILRGTLFQEVVAAEKTAALLTPYPQGYFDVIASGKRRYSSVPFAATEAGVRLRTADDLRHGRALSPDFTSEAWHTLLGETHIPLYGLAEAGEKMAELAQAHTFSFFEHWPSDQIGHRGTLAEAVSHLQKIDAVFGGLLSAWDDAQGLLIVTSDHGNLEDKSHRRHTRNRVGTILVGRGHEALAAQVDDLTDIAKIVRVYLGFDNKKQSG